MLVRAAVGSLVLALLATTAAVLMLLLPCAAAAGGPPVPSFMKAQTKPAAPERPTPNKYHNHEIRAMSSGDFSLGQPGGEKFNRALIVVSTDACEKSFAQVVPKLQDVMESPAAARTRIGALLCTDGFSRSLCQVVFGDDISSQPCQYVIIGEPSGPRQLRVEAEASPSVETLLAFMSGEQGNLNADVRVLVADLVVGLAGLSGAT
jgi:hypothetical protein